MAAGTKSHARIDTNHQITRHSFYLLPGGHDEQMGTNTERFKMDFPTTAPIFRIDGSKNRRCENGIRIMGR